MEKEKKKKEKRREKEKKRNKKNACMFPIMCSTPYVLLVHIIIDMNAAIHERIR